MTTPPPHDTRATRPGRRLRFRARGLRAAALLLVGFVALAWLTTLTVVDAVEVATDLIVNTVMTAHPLLVVVTVVVTTAGSPVSIDVLTGVAALLVAFRYGTDGRRVAVYLVAARLVELGVETAVKNLVGRPRPVLPHPLAHADNLSFPSGHTAGTAVFCAALLVAAWPYLRRRTLAVVLAACVVVAVAASRVALGLHYPIDVLGGALLGVAVALVLSPLLPLCPDDGFLVAG